MIPSEPEIDSCSSKCEVVHRRPPAGPPGPEVAPFSADLQTFVDPDQLILAGFDSSHPDQNQNPSENLGLGETGFQDPERPGFDQDPDQDHRWDRSCSPTPGPTDGTGINSEPAPRPSPPPSSCFCLRLVGVAGKRVAGLHTAAPSKPGYSRRRKMTKSDITKVI